MIKRIWGIRHVRWLIVAYLMWRHYRSWGELMGYMPVINQSDVEALDAIWRGEA